MKAGFKPSAEAGIVRKIRSLFAQGGKKTPSQTATSKLAKGAQERLKPGPATGKIIQKK